MDAETLCDRRRHRLAAPGKAAHGLWFTVDEIHEFGVRAADIQHAHVTGPDPADLARGQASQGEADVETALGEHRGVLFQGAATQRRHQYILRPAVRRRLAVRRSRAVQFRGAAVTEGELVQRQRELALDLKAQEALGLVARGRWQLE